MRDVGVYSGHRLLPQLIAWVLFAALCPLGFAADEDTELMVDRLPFDRVTLNAANDDAALDVVLLELPDRRVPDPLPTEGELKVRQLSNPSVLYTVDWSGIAKVELFEQLVLADALRLTAAGKSADAFRTLQFLHAHYAKLPGLDTASEQYVKREALDAFAAKRYDESLAILLSLYDINPQHRGLAEAVQTVSDRVITAYLSARDFAAARGVLELLKEGFPDLSLANVATWDAKFQEAAGRELQLGQEAVSAERYNDARVAIRRADDILPGLPEVVDLMRRIDHLAPQLIVGVNQLVTDSDKSNKLEWAHARVSRLTNPPLVQIVDFAAEGGVYHSRWATLESDDAGLRLDLTLTPDALRQRLSPERVSLGLLQLADSASPRFQADFAALFENVSINGGDRVSIQWRRPHVRPESLVRLSLVDLHAGDDPPGVYRSVPDEEIPTQRRYQLPAGAGDSIGPSTIIERVFDSEEEALAALRQGEVSVLDQVPPWQVEQLRSDNRLTVDTYRLPTVHVLQMNYANPLLGNREFRRALCYGINREGILRDLVLAKEQRPGFRTLTGPMPAGLTLSDSVGYAYNQQLPPRPYEPRLAAVLSNVARATLAKQAAAPPPSSEPELKESEETTESEEAETPPLVLVYPPEPVARMCCEAIRLQLTAIGVPIELKELSSESSELPASYDLRYVELAIHEPLVDARRLLGPGGSSGICSPSMSLALERVDQAKNWREARERLQVVHQVAYYDLPVIPLWQTIDSFAYRKSLTGLDAKPVALYQNVADWGVSYDGGTRQ